MPPARPRAGSLPWPAACLLLIALGLIIGLVPTSGYGQDDPAVRAAGVLDAVNRVRESRGLPAVAPDVRLGAAAQTHAQDMARTGRMTHVGSAGDTLEDRLRASGYAYVQVAENIAAGQPGPQDLIDDWMASPGHRANMLDPEATQIGVGYAFRSNDPYGHYWTLVLAEPALSVADAPPQDSSVAETLLAEVNRARGDHGLPALRLASRLGEAARRHTHYMADSGHFAHEGPNGESVADRVVAAGYAYRYVAENIAAGQASANEVVVAWMNSPGHRANMLNPTVVEIGVGYTFRTDDPYHHYWTLVLAAPR